MSNTNILIHILNALIGGLCIAILGLTAHAVALKDDLDSILPSSVKKTGMTFLFWPGCGGLVDMLLFILLWSLTPWEQGLVCLSLDSGLQKHADGAKTNKQAAYLNGLLFVASFILGRPLIVLIFTFVEWGRAVKSETSTYSGHLTVETWACAFSKQDGNNFADSLCKELQAARYLLIPVLVLGAMMLTLMLRKRFLVAKGVVQ
ncbi:hypothetical protein AA0112_g8235 [Alternaria arborescens]|nr:hypothetical protein AA0112_g8235 [Alternaria arborescens]